MPTQRILFLGEISPGQTSHMRMRALTRLGYEVRGIDTAMLWKKAGWLRRQVQRRLERGGVIDRLNDAVIAAARDFKPDLVWAEKQEFLRVETLAALRALGARLLHFTPDPYFTLAWKRTRLMNAALGAFDLLVYCKSYERVQYAALGKPLLYMPLGYCDEVHRPLPSTDPQWQCLVGFMGGWEPYRERMMHALVAAGFDLKIRGGYWEFLGDGRWSLRRRTILKQLAGDESFSIHRDELVWRAWQGGEVYGDDYARALSGAKIGLGLLRRVCPDQHTTRTFEIPACGSLLLADRTEEHRAFFTEGVEAEYFDTPEEMLDKTAFYAANETARMRVAAAGHQRCIDGRYAYVHRLKDVLDAVDRI